MSDFRMKELEAEVANRGPLTDRSGTITSGGNEQTIMAANGARSYLLFQNLSTGDLWLNFGVAATAGVGSVRVAAGGTLLQEAGFVSTDAIHVFGATTAAPFTVKEG